MKSKIFFWVLTSFVIFSFFGVQKIQAEDTSSVGGCWCTVNESTEIAPFQYGSCADQSKDGKDYTGCKWEGAVPSLPCDQRDDVCTFIDCEKWCNSDGQCTWEKGVCGFKSTAGNTSDDSVSGADVLDTPNASALNPLAVTSVYELIGNAIKTLMGLLGSLALVMFVYGGVLWMASAGNAERSKKGTQIVVWSSLGVLVILASWTIVDFVFEAFR